MSLKIFTRVIGAIAMACWSSASTPATGLNVPVAARVISFIQPTPQGILPVAIVYQPGNATSEAEAVTIERALATTAQVGRARLKTRRVATSNLAALDGAKAAFVTSSLRSYQDDVAQAATSRSILTITSDTTCVMAERCVVGITSADRTQIIVSRAAARRNGIRFGSAFLMLVKEI